MVAGPAIQPHRRAFQALRGLCVHHSACELDGRRDSDIDDWGPAELGGDTSIGSVRPNARSAVST